MSDPLADGISSVELIYHMGNDLMVVNAARVSFAKVSLKFKETDKGLIHYLAKHNHWTPFGHPQLQFRIKMPIFIAREWYRHNVGIVRNEVSRRYVDCTPELYIPKEWRKRNPDKKQGSLEEFVPDINGLRFYGEQQQWDSLKAYECLLEMGVAPEMARMVLPQSMYTEFIETASLYAYARICGLRIAPDAQKETRKYAEAISEQIAPLYPVSWKELRA